MVIYEYDANANRTSTSLGGSTRAYTTAATSNRLTGLSNPAVSFTHDAAGNTLSGSTVAVAYSGSYLLENRLGSITASGLTSSYSYNHAGQRVRKAGSTGAGSVVVFVYDLQGHLLGEYDSTGAALREYVWLGDEPVAMFTPNGANPPNVYYLHNDHIDTPRVVLDRSGNLRWRWMAEPFGTTAPETNPQGLGAFAFNLRMPGQYFDAETGLVYNWHRDYDGGIGRYIQSDPIGLAGGINTYAYVGGNPISLTDFYGLVASLSRCASAILSSREVSRTEVAEEFLFTVWLMGLQPGQVPTAGPNLDPRHPRRFPLQPEIELTFVTYYVDHYRRNTYRLTELVQQLMNWCTWKITDECGREREETYYTSKEQRVRLNEQLISQEYFSRRRDIRRHFSFGFPP